MPWAPHVPCAAVFCLSLSCGGTHSLTHNKQQQQQQPSCQWLGPLLLGKPCFCLRLTCPSHMCASSGHTCVPPWPPAPSRPAPFGEPCTRGLACSGSRVFILKTWQASLSLACKLSLGGNGEHSRH